MTTDPVRTHEPIVLTFNSWEEAQEAYYRVNQCEYHDPDKEEGRIMRWLEENGYNIAE